MKSALAFFIKCRIILLKQCLWWKNVVDTHNVVYLKLVNQMKWDNICNMVKWLCSESVWGEVQISLKGIGPIAWHCNKSILIDIKEG